MSVYTVSLRDTSNLGQVNVGDGTLLANLSVSAGRGPKGDGWTGVTYDESTGTFIFTSNDGLAYTSPDVRPEVDLDNVDINSGTIDGTVIGGSTAAAGSFTTGSFTGIDVTGTVTADGLTVQGDISATGGDVDLDTLDLNAIAASKAVTAVDVFVYDTSRDTDGGAWRKRTQGTSWYNEALNTATRGSRKEFPAVAVIVAEATKVTIYDGDDPSLPMWMVFEGSANKLPYFGPSSGVSSLSALNGTIAIGCSGTFGAFTTIGFIEDKGYALNHSAYVNERTIANRAVNAQTIGTADYYLVNRTVNDVAMTVLPNAPIDAATGLPVPTIAVATDGGVSVIKDDGTVYNPTGTTYDEGPFSFNEDFSLALYSRGASPAKSIFAGRNTAVMATSGGDYISVAETDFRNNSQSILAYLRTSTPDFFNPNADGISHLHINGETFANSMVALTNSEYATGYQVGDIKGAFLSDTDDTDLVGGVELVTNGTFDTDTDWTKGTGWTIGSGVATAVGAGGYLVQTNVLGNGVSKVIKVSWDQTITSGTRFRFFARNDTDSSNAIILSGSATGGATYGGGNCNGSGTFTVYVQTTDGFAFKLLAESGNDGTIDNVSVTEADADRSVNANHLTVNGTVTRSPVATGADLVAYSGFSASNYLEQPYNSDLDFGTGDFCVMGWMKTAGDEVVVGRFDKVSGTPNWDVRVLGGELTFIVNGSNKLAPSVTVTNDAWVSFCVIRDNGVLSSYVNGVLDATNANTQDLTNTVATLGVGARVDAVPDKPFAGSLALLRISATAPTAEQIAKIYNDEKVLFQENAQATLYGSSDAVTALAHDDATNLLHVGTSAGRSVFQGLRRVENTTTAVGTAISAANNMIVEE